MLMQILVLCLLCVITTTICYQLKIGKELLNKLDEVINVIKQRGLEKDSYNVNKKEETTEINFLQHEEVPLATGFIHVSTDEEPPRLNIKITKNN